MRRGVTDRWTRWYDAGRIDSCMTDEIVLLDVIKMHGRRNTWVLVEVPHITRQVRKVGQPFEVAFEVPDIDRIESHQGSKQSPIRFSVGIAG